MKCSICGNKTEFITILTEQYNCKYVEKRKYFLLTEPQTLDYKFYCNSERCKDEKVRVYTLEK